MQMRPADAITYPRFASYVQRNFPTIINTPSMRVALQRIGQIDRPLLTRVLPWGHGPLIVVVRLNGGWGEFTPNVGSNEIRLHDGLVQSFEAGTDWRNARAGRVRLTAVTLLHELVHWGDDQDGIDRPGEEGEEFERAIYGRVL